MNPLVSIIVPCCNQAQYLTETLVSVREQTYSHWECIIVNDGSSDNTEEIAKQYCDKDSRFRYYSKSNEGVSAARNYGINVSKGEFILPLDADDIIAQNFILYSIEEFKKNPQTKLVTSKVALFGEMHGEWSLKSYEYKRLLFENMLVVTAIYKCSDFKKSSGYNTNMKEGFEDWDFWIGFLEAEDIVCVIPEVLFYYRIKKLSRNSTIDYENKRKLLQQIVENNYVKYQVYFKDILYQRNIIDNQLEIISNQFNEIARLKNTYSYKIGHFIVKTINLFRLNAK